MWSIQRTGWKQLYDYGFFGYLFESCRFNPGLTRNTVRTVNFLMSTSKIGHPEVVVLSMGATICRHSECGLAKSRNGRLKISNATPEYAGFWRPFKTVGGLFGSRLTLCIDLFAILAQSYPDLVFNWSRRSIRNVVSRQLLYTFVDAVPVTVRIGAAAGLLLIVQTAMLGQSIGNIQDLLPTITTITVRDLAPIIASLIVIVRSGSAIATELSIMEITEENELIESLGIDPMSYVVMPRVVGTTLAVPLLATIILIVMFTTGYFVGLLINVIRTSPMEYFDGICRSLTLDDAWFFFPKTFFTGAIIGAICCIEGLQVKTALTETPRVASKTGVRCLTAVFLISAILSFLLYGKLLVFEIF